MRKYKQLEQYISDTPKVGNLSLNIEYIYISNYLLTSLFIFFKGGLAAQQRVAVARSTAFVTLLIRQCKAKYGGRTLFGSMGTTKLF